jgi:hypothetical protein
MLVDRDWVRKNLAAARILPGTVTLTGFTTNYCTCAASRVQSNQQLSLFSRTQKLALLG